MRAACSVPFGTSMVSTPSFTSALRLSAGTVVGTPAYLAPERVVAATAKTVEPTVDIYAVGVILYELCCGKKPFSADDTATLIRLHLTAQPTSPRTLRPELDPQLEQALLRALAKLPSERFDSAAAFRDALLALPPLTPELAAARPPLQGAD